MATDDIKYLFISTLDFRFVPIKDLQNKQPICLLLTRI